MLLLTSGEKRSCLPLLSVMIPWPPVTARANDMMRTVGTDSTSASSSAS